MLLIDFLEKKNVKRIIEFIETAYSLKVRKFTPKFMIDLYGNIIFIGIKHLFIELYQDCRAISLMIVKNILPLNISCEWINPFQLLMTLTWSKRTNPWHLQNSDNYWNCLKNLILLKLEEFKWSKLKNTNNLFFLYYYNLNKYIDSLRWSIKMTRSTQLLSIKKWE